MTVGELIQLLERYPPDMRVVVNGYEEGYDDLSPEQISIVRVLLGHRSPRVGGPPRRPARRIRTVAEPCVPGRCSGPPAHVELIRVSRRIAQ